MSDWESMLQLAVSHHRAGRLDEAERLYRQTLSAEPENADAHHLLGMVALARGQAAEAIGQLREAIARRGTSGEFHEHLAAAYQAAGQAAPAAESARQAVRLAPGSATAHNELGNALRALGEFAEAEAAYRVAVGLDPRLAVAYNNLGNALLDQRRLGEAIECLRQAAALQPHSAEIQFNLANAYRASGNNAEAESAYRRALAIRPDWVDAHLRLATVLCDERNFADAMLAYREALRLRPEWVEALNGLTAVWQLSGNLVEARAYCERALKIEPNDVTATHNLGAILHAEGRYDEAERQYRAVLAAVGAEHNALTGLADIALHRGDFSAAIDHYQQALQVWPDSAHASFRLGVIRLTQGRLLEGWSGLERVFGPKQYPQPRWDGTDLGSKMLLVQADWGFGDLLHFARYLPLLRVRAPRARIMLEADRRLIPLLVSSGYDDLIPRGDAPPPFDVLVSIMSLPRIFGTTLETIPADAPYLKADPELVERWRARLAEFEGFKVGIHWQGNRATWPDHHRSLPLSHFEPLSRVGGVRLISLQKGPGSEQVAQVGERFEVLELKGLDEQGGAFMDTAAVLENLDLVITSDSAVAHLAGALARPVWLALSTVPEWRWLLERADSPWYPTMRLFRQVRLDQWDEVFGRMAEALAQEVAARGSVPGGGQP